MQPSILLIDNYDSFTYNLFHCLEIAGAASKILRNDDPHLIHAAAKFDAIVISPGPSKPSNSNYSPKIISRYSKDKPILGICLGMQILNESFGGSTIRADVATHGKVSEIKKIGESKILYGLPDSFSVARYHSLACSSIPQEFKIIAKYSGIPMAIEHEQLPLFGLQFHPESFLAEFGQEIINNFITLIK